MFIYHLPGMWRNRRGLAHAFRHPGQMPLVSAIAMYASALLLVGGLVIVVVVGINLAITANDPPNYYCKNYAADQQPEFGCQKGGITPNIAPR